MKNEPNAQLLADRPGPSPGPAGALDPVDGNAVLDLIVRTYPRLSRTERQVADLVLLDPEAFTRTAISQITALSSASAPSILRFCRAVGCTGLTDLKFALVASLGERAPAPPPAQPARTALAILDQASAAIMGLRRQVDGAAVSDAVTLLAAATAITCHASYSVRHAADYARDRFLRHAMPALTPESPAYTGAPLSGKGAHSAGLFFCDGVPDAAMIDAIVCYRRHGQGAVVLGDAAVTRFVAPSVHILIDARQHGHAALLPCWLMTDILLEAIARQRALN